jgi:hypothetical protein
LEEERVKVEQKNKVFIKKLQDENEELKGNPLWLKSYNDKLLNLRLKAEIWDHKEEVDKNIIYLLKKNRRLWIVK